MRIWFTHQTLLPLFAIAAAACLLSGCDDYNHVKHTPPDGFGAIVINNHTYTKVDVFINGMQNSSVGDGRDRAYDMTSGVYRVVLVEHDGTHSYGADTDVLQNQNTVLDVSFDPVDYTRYDVAVFFSAP
jgi:hypothetical protein